MPDACRILIVDDDPITRFTVHHAARSAGYAAVAVADGETALGLVADGLSPDLVVTDLEMPGLDGVGLLESLGALDSFAGTTTIMYSAGSRPRGNGGADLWVSKAVPRALDIALQEFVSGFTAASARQPAPVA